MAGFDLPRISLGELFYSDEKGAFVIHKSRSWILSDFNGWDRSLAI